MRSPSRDENGILTSSDRLGQFLRQFRLLLFVVVSGTLLFWVYSTFAPVAGGAGMGPDVGDGSLMNSIYKLTPGRAVRQRLGQSRGPSRVAIIAGHLENDSGAVCDDGLTEVSVNLAVAQKVSARLAEAGVGSEIMAEFDERLNGFSGTAVVSIHADSCTSLGADASGFKIAGSSRTNSTQLQQCVRQNYQAVTQLSYHADTITEHMTDYHVFREISTSTQAIILEIGFLNQDRSLLVDRSDSVARGIANGILCFVDYLHG